MTSLSQRMIGAAKLDVHIYEEVEGDTNATGQALMVVVLSSIAVGIGSLMPNMAGPPPLGGFPGLLTGTVTALTGWFIWAFLVYLIGTKLIPEPNTRSDVPELLRTIGFSASPGLLRVLGLVPVLGPVIIFSVNIWMLIAMVVAVRQALDYESTGRAIGVCLIGWFARTAVLEILIASVGGRPT